MELHGEVYLFNLSLLAITFAVVSAVVMLLRQVMGGSLSNFDIYLIATYISFGFGIAICAVLPPLVSMFAPPAPILWLVSSMLSAALLAAMMVSVIAHRRRASPQPTSFGVKMSFAMHWIDIALMLINAIVPAVQGVGLFAAGLTLSLGSVMWAFVRRIASLLGEKPGEDWDPRLG
jgi:hypothetical protein